MLSRIKDSLRPAWIRLRHRSARARNRQKARYDGTVRWGVMGTGAIARQFANGLSFVPEAHLAAVGSRTAESAGDFAGLFSIPRAHASYEALAADPDIDVIYVATLNPRHCADVLLCLENGKHVLCEKPFALNARQAERMIAEARKRGRFLMEAMWTRFMPATREFVRVLKSGEAGWPRNLSASFGFKVPFTPDSRLYSPAKGGGALLDIGVYPLSFAHLLFGVPERVEASVMRAESGVDAAGSVTLFFSGNRRAELSFAINQKLANEAVAESDVARVKLLAPFWQSSAVVLEREGDPARFIECPVGESGYTHEAQAVTDMILAGKKEHHLMPLDDTLAVMKTLDKVRDIWGLKYPGED